MGARPATPPSSHLEPRTTHKRKVLLQKGLSEAPSQRGSYLALDRDGRSVAEGAPAGFQMSRWPSVRLLAGWRPLVDMPVPAQGQLNPFLP